MTETNETRNSSKQRKPRQERSKARVEAILNATKELIEEKGSAALKIQEIAARAGVTAGSMYQYFPNKQAIMHALFEQYIEQVENMLATTVIDIDSVNDLTAVFNQLYDQYYTLYLEAPVLQDIVASRSVDKSLYARDIEDSRNNAATMFTASKHLFAETQHPVLKRYLFLMVQLSGSMMQFAANLEPEESQLMVDLSKRLLSASVIDAVVQNPG